jgi:hypothetical protein
MIMFFCANEKFDVIMNIKVIILQKNMVDFDIGMELKNSSGELKSTATRCSEPIALFN